MNGLTTARFFYMKLLSRFRSIQGSLLLHELSFFIIILVTASVGIVWAFAWQQSSEESLRLTSMNNHMQNIRGELYRQLKEVFDANFLDDESAPEEYEDYTNRINGFIQELKQEAIEGRELHAVIDIEVAYQRFHGETSLLLTADNPSEQQKELLNLQLEKYTFKELEDAFGQFESLLNSKQYALADDRQKWMSQLMLLVPIPVLLAFTLLLLSRQFVNNNVLKPLARVMHGARRFSKGDLKHEIKRGGVEELVRLSDAINSMANDLAINRDRLIDAKKQAALGELVPIVAHNIRNPLAGIRAASQVTLDENTEPEIQEALKDIIIAVDRLERWVTSLLTYLHPIKAHFIYHSLTAAADNALLMMDLQLKDKDIQIRREGWDTGSTELMIDINLMEQAIFNLLQNGIEASAVSSEIVLVYKEDIDHIELSIRDKGKGINFDPIEENVIGRDETKRLSFGLGIPFTLKVIKQHQGELIYNANEEKGTSVTIKLPKLIKVT